MPRVLVNAIVEVSTAQLDDEHDSGITEEAHDELFDKLSDIGCQSIDIELMDE